MLESNMKYIFQYSLTSVTHFLHCFNAQGYIQPYNSVLRLKYGQKVYFG